MQIPILIEPVAGNGYRAVSAEPLAITVEGATREEALAKMRDKLDVRLRNGAEVVTMEVADSANPWVKSAGMHQGDPLIAEWKASMTEYRKSVDVDAHTS